MLKISSKTKCYGWKGECGLLFIKSFNRTALIYLPVLALPYLSVLDKLPGDSDKCL